MVLKKGNILILLLAATAVVAILITSYFFWQSQNINKQSKDLTPTPTLSSAPLDWKQISDSTQGYSLKTPFTWTQVEGSPEFPTVSEFRAPDDSRLRIETSHIKNESLSNYLKNLDKLSETGYEGTPSKIVLSAKSLIVGGEQGIQRQEDWPAAGFTTTVTYVKSGTTIYTISVIPSTPDPKLFNDLDVVKSLSQVLASFSFIPTEVQNSNPTKNPPIEFSCPPQEKYAKGYLNCMPSPDNADLKYCNSDYQTWMQSNCPPLDVAN